MAQRRLLFRAYALQRMFERGVSVEAVRIVVDTGEIIREYTDDTPYPSRLLLGWIGSRPLHIVIANNSADNEVIVITAYEPDASQWEPDFKRRRL